MYFRVTPGCWSPISLVACVLAWRDLARMRAGLMDPCGRGEVERVLEDGLLTATLTTLGIAPVWAILLLFLHEAGAL